MGKALVVALLAAAIGFAAWRTLRRARHGGGCCGEHESSAPRAAVRDRDRRHYPYAVTLRVEGMVCQNCARRVENALNALDGAWATVDLGAKQARVRLKQPPDAAALCRAVRDAGYAASVIDPAK